MRLNESTVEDAALTWFAERSYAVGQGVQFAPGEPAAERNSLSELLPVGRLREAIRRLNTISDQSLTLATLRDTLLPKLLSGELSVASLERGFSA